MPTTTKVPMAVRINGEGILLSEYEAELKRYQAGAEQFGSVFNTVQAKQDVLDDLIAQTLFAQAAADDGFVLDEASLQARMDEYIQALGGQEKLDSWLAENFYDTDSFRSAVARNLAVIWARNKLLDQVPETAEQVHARQILVDDENEAIGIQRQLEVGASFKDLAFQYDPLTGGELGWFSRGYLLQPDVEAAAFTLETGQYSAIIPTSYGFHVIEIIEKDPQRVLAHDALLMMQRQALEGWLAARIENSTIEVLLP